MLRWWPDETKGYRLEDLENGKIITSRDVNFQEDTTPSDLAHDETGLTRSEPEEINEFVNDAIHSNSNTSYHESIPNPFEHDCQNDDMETDDDEVLENDLQYPSRPTTPENMTIINPPAAPRKGGKWDDLPRHNPSTREQCIPTRF